MQWSSAFVRRHFALSLLLGLALACVSVAGGAAAPWEHLSQSRQGVVAAVPAGDRLTLADGTEVALAGLRAPRAGTASNAGEPGFAEAQAALAAIALGQRVRLYGPPDRRDRLGRSLAHPVLDGPANGKENTPEDGAGRWLQALMLTGGMARAYPLAGEQPALATAMLALESEARKARRGLWSRPDFAVRSAASPERISPGFQLVEGRVLAIGESTHSLFLNFGTDWRQDFTAVVERRDRDGFAKGLASVRALQGRLIRVRGAVFDYGGPAIRVRHGYAVELLEEEQER